MKQTSQRKEAPNAALIRHAHDAIFPLPVGQLNQRIGRRRALNLPNKNEGSVDGRGGEGREIRLRRTGQVGSRGTRKTLTVALTAFCLTRFL
jgi:hypothetical protein